MDREELLRRYAAGERDFSGVSLRGLDFSDCDLSGINLTNADLESTEWEGANLTGVDLSQARIDLPGGIDNPRIANAILCDTTLPNGENWTI